MSESLSMEELAKRGEVSLAHYGVRGMKWGVRKGGSSGGMSMSPRAKAAVKTGAKIGLRIGAGAGLAAIGVPVAVNSAVIAATDAKLLTYGRDATKLLLDDFGIINMGAIEKFSAEARTNKSVADFNKKIS